MNSAIKILSVLFLLGAVASPVLAQDGEAGGFEAPPEPVEAPVDYGTEPTGPSIDLANDEAVDAPAGHTASAPTDELRGMQEHRFATAASTSLGGYGELHYGANLTDDEHEIDLHRLVLFFAHNFTDSIRVYTEVEVEHAFFSADSGAGEVGIEQAFVDWKLLGESLGLRAGVVLIPMGIVNQWHEPPTFNGVERPNVDKVIIPSTWREGGIGIFGEPSEGLRYELYLTSALEPAGFRTKDGVRGGRQKVSEALMSGTAVSGRLEYEPMLGLVAGVSGYASFGGANTQDCTDPADPATCTDFDGSVTVVGASADARFKSNGFQARAVGALFSISGADELNASVGGTGEAPDMTLGGYVEAGYNVLQATHEDQELIPFARFEYYDTTFAHGDPMLEGTRATTDIVVGVTYKPIPQVVFKGDFIARSVNDTDNSLLNLGLGWMF